MKTSSSKLIVVLLALAATGASLDAGGKMSYRGVSRYVPPGSRNTLKFLARPSMAASIQNTSCVRMTSRRSAAEFSEPKRRCWLRVERRSARTPGGDSQCAAATCDRANGALQAAGDRPIWSGAQKPFLFGRPVLPQRVGFGESQLDPLHTNRSQRTSGNPHDFLIWNRGGAQFTQLSPF